MAFPEGISLVYVEALEDDCFQEFADDLNEIGIVTTVNSRPNPGPQASLEWLMPTAVMAGIAGGFFAETGKELFHLLKSKLANFTNETIQKPRIEPVMYGTSGKLKENNPYSSAFSIYSEAKMNRRFKLMIPKYSSDTDYNQIVFAYLDFLKDYNDGLVCEDDIGVDLTGGLSSTILVHYNITTNRIEWLDPLPPHVRAKIQTVQ
ncbi:hypothetical protein [Paraglaciecola sp.]|uniref:hypothetical protein n=1 Tax=Paraglaciecola sp. TaxID=1920173 RepID=UPI00326418C9